MIKPAVVICDFCGKELKASNQVSLPVITDCEWDEGHSVKPYVAFVKYDICEDCLIKATNIYVGYRGLNPQFIRKEIANDRHN